MAGANTRPAASLEVTVNQSDTGIDFQNKRCDLFGHRRALQADKRAQRSRGIKPNDAHAGVDLIHTLLEHLARLVRKLLQLRTEQISKEESRRINSCCSSSMLSSMSASMSTASEKNQQKDREYSGENTRDDGR